IMADINAIADELAQDEQGAPILILQKDGDPYLAPDGSEVTITVLGTDSKAFRHAKEVTQRKLLRTRRTKLEPADLLDNRITHAAAAIVGWHGWVSGDQPFPFTPDNAKALLRAEHILEQVEAGIAGHADFFKRSSRS
ncbi:MAG: hypothetical protein H0X64_15595, partial [Gemmatimonadaceae bacterium]|nr:hypothetical protein [Gemmatimonadaceae bacterium]